MTSEGGDDLRKLVYPETYFVGLAPQELRLALLSRGVLPPAGKPFRYLELGFGNGFSLNVHAAANDGEFWGNDFVREHVDGASAVASISGAKARFLPDSFADLLKRDSDLPQFDMIAAHGIWTWVPDEDRAAIVELLKRKLAPGGAFYVSYNNTAGWSSVVFLRQMMKLYLAEHGERADVVRAVEFARSLQGAGAAYFKENPTAAAEVAQMAHRNPTYLRQEYFLDDWKLMSLGEIEAALAPAELKFCAQFPLILHDDDLVLGASGREIMSTIESRLLQETVREAFQGMGFRQDIFVKNPVKLSGEQRREHFRAQRFLLTTKARNVQLKGGSPWGELDLGAKGCVPVLEAMESLGAGAHALRDVEAKLPSMPIGDLIARIILLASVRVVRPAVSAEEQSLASAPCQAFNAYLLGQPAGDKTVLASPVLGAGVEVSKLERTALQSHASGKRTVAEYADEITRACPDELRGRNAEYVAQMLQSESLPMLRAMGLVHP